MTIDVDALVAEVTPETPSGEDLSYDAAMMELETEFAGKEAQQMGDEVVEAVEPVNLSVAEIQLEGMPGLEQSLRLLHQTLERHWDTVHPQLDPDDDNDPLERINILSAMASPPGTLGDPIKFRDRVQSAKLTDSRAIGRVSYRDILHSQEPAGEGDGEGGDGEHRYSSSEINAAFQDTAEDWLLATHESIKASRDLVQEIDNLLMDKVGAGGGVNFDGLLGDLKTIESEMTQQLRRLGHGVEGPEGDEEEAAAGGGGSSGGPALSGEVNTARDAELALDKVIRYYEQHEPSSPVPVLVKVARAMISKSFLEISQALPPDTVELIVRITGEAGGGSEAQAPW
jgi:type VI secretion system protein ImpA